MARTTGEKGRRTPALERIAPGIALSRGEVVLDAGTRPADDPTLLLRAAAEAAERDPVLAPTTAARLVREGAELPVPWPAPARDALVRLLASGDGLLPVWETLDEIDGIETFLPEWEQIRLLPHASAIHRFTVDRHVVETCAEAGVADPGRTPSRPAAGRGAAPRHRQGLAARPLRRGRAAGPQDRGPDGLHRPRRRGGRLPRALAPAAGHPRHDPRPRRPGDHRRAPHPRARRRQPRAAARPHRGRRPRRVAGRLDGLAGLARRPAGRARRHRAGRRDSHVVPVETLPVPDAVRRDATRRLRRRRPARGRARRSPSSPPTGSGCSPTSPAGWPRCGCRCTPPARGRRWTPRASGA